MCVSQSLHFINDAHQQDTCAISASVAGKWEILKTQPCLAFYLQGKSIMKQLQPFWLLCGAVLLSVSITSCKKYDDGPLINLTPRNERVANTWVIDNATADGNDVTSDFDNYVLTLSSGGNADLVATYTVFGVDFLFDTNGTWTFQNNDEELVLDFENDTADGTYQIRRLTETQLWLHEVGDDLELHLKPQ